MERKPITLAYPITVTRFEEGTAKTVTINEVTVAPRIKGRHMRRADHANGLIEAKLLVFAAMTGLSNEEADELDSVDIAAIEAAIADEQSDLQRIATALGLDPDAPADRMIEAIAGLRAEPAGAAEASVEAHAPLPDRGDGAD